jgi:hypothetical protein
MHHTTQMECQTTAPVETFVAFLLCPTPTQGLNGSKMSDSSNDNFLSYSFFPYSSS